MKAGGEEVIEGRKDAEAEDGKLGLAITEVGEEGSSFGVKFLSSVREVVGGVGGRAKRLSEEADAVDSFFGAGSGRVEEAEGFEEMTLIGRREGVEGGSTRYRGEDDGFVKTETHTMGGSMFFKRLDEGSEVSIGKGSVSVVDNRGRMRFTIMRIIVDGGVGGEGGASKA